jgi:group I intron endonuclease
MLIYKITNTINLKIYIGQTTKTLKERKENYYKEYRWGKNPRPIIKAMRKYGFENFSFEIVEDKITSQEELDSKERYYITEKYHSLIKEGGYNIERGGNSFGKHTEETKRKIGEAQKGELNHRYGKVGVLNSTSKPILDLTTGMRYESACLAAKALKLNFSHVCAVARGKRGSTGGRVFRYIDNYNKPIKPDNVCEIKNKKLINKILPEYKKFI